MFKLPLLQTTGDVTTAMATIIAAVASAEITPGEAAELAKLLQAHVAAIEANEFDQRLRALEAKYERVGRNSDP
jgi:hypothetical protein